MADQIKDGMTYALAILALLLVAGAFLAFRHFTTKPHERIARQASREFKRRQRLRSGRGWF